MKTYRYADIVIASTLPLDGLLPDAAPGLPAAFAVEMGAEDSAETRHEDGSGIGHLAIERQGSGYLLDFRHLARFRLSADGCRIEVLPGPGCNRETLAHLLLDQVLPRALGHRGQLVLHGGAVSVADGAIALLGPSGVGKSTLAASFHAAGHALLSDDGIVLEQDGAHVRVRPTYRSLRLWPSAVDEVFATPPPAAPVAHYTTKQRITFAPAREPALLEPRRLLAVLVLVEEQDDAMDTPVAVRRLGPADTLMALMHNAFRIDVTGYDRLAPLFGKAGDMAALVPAHAVTYPRSFDALPMVRNAILDGLKLPGAAA